MSISLAFVLLSGCAPTDQIWLFQVPWLNEPDCQQEISHNFVDAYIPETPPGDWLETDESDQSDALYFAQFVPEGTDSAVLVIANEVWPGTSTGDGEWEFTWTGVEDTRSSREHDAGYRFTEQAYSETRETITMAIDQDTASGEWAVVTTTDFTWTESDEWDAEVGLPVGDIPSATYLAYDLDEAEGLPRTNMSDEIECGATTCQLRVVDTCSGSRDYEAILTGYSEEEAYDQLEATTQPHGTGA